MVKNKRSKMILNVLIGIFFLIAIFQFYTTFSLDLEYQMESPIYDIGEEYIEGISPNTDISLFLKYFDLENCSIEVVDGDNKKVDSGYVKNGSKTILYDHHHQVLRSYINVIKGDYYQDGRISNNDYKEMGKCLVSSCSLQGYQNKSVDLDNDGEFHLNDLMLLDQAITFGYTGISLDKDDVVLQSEEQGRLIARVQPSYGVNQNVRWNSLDESIVTVNEAGQVIGHQEGETRIQATTMDGKFIAESIVKVDNTIQLLSYEGIGYIGGNDVVVGIKLIDYDGVICSSSNESIASCEIQGKKLILRAKQQGNVEVMVTSPKYGEVVYHLDTYSVYLNVMPRYLCTTPNNIQYITVSGFHSGLLSFEASDKEIIKNSYMEVMNGRNMLKIEFGSKQGRATLQVKEANGNSSNEVMVDVYQISIPQIGSIAKVGTEISTTIVGDNLGTLTCVSADSNKATCRIEGNQLIVTPLALGSVTIEVYNQFSYYNSFYDCGKAQFLVVIQE